MIWRLIKSPGADIFSQMNRDRELFESFLQDPLAPPLLRIYRVSQPAMTVGRSWRMEKNVCLRPTGGGLVRHGNDLIYSVMARRDSFPTFRQARTSYLSFHEAVQEAFQKLGIETRLFRCDDPRARPLSKRASQPEDCFHRPVPTDVAWGEKKIAGAAQWRRKESFLHQGSVELLKGVSFEALKGALEEAFREKFGLVWETADDKMRAVG